MTVDDLAWLTWDNPVLIKHVRSRLRPGQAIPWFVVVAVLCVSTCWAGYELNWLINAQALGMITGLQVFLLLFIGSAQVSASATKARTSGILDFHRVAPLPPLHLMLGFFLGGPVREYALFACTLPFALFCAYQAPIGIPGYLLFLIPLMLGCWIGHGLGLLNSLLGKAAGSTARGVLGAIAMFYLIGGGVGGMVGFASDLFGEKSGSLDFYGVTLPWLPVVVGYQVPVLMFLLYGSVRRMRSERAHVSSKPVAAVAMLVLAFLLLGGFWSYGRETYAVLSITYALAVAAVVLLTAVTPDSAEYAKGVRRAERQGRSHARFWDDLALNRGLVMIFAVIVLVTPTIAWNAIEGRMVLGSNGRELSYSLPIAIAVFVVAYFGLALQWFLMAFRRGSTFMALFVFFAWLVPVVAGSIVAAGGADERVSLPIVALSPLPGVALAAGISPLENHDLIRAAALVPALLFALIFNNMVTNARRKADRLLHETRKLRHPLETDGEVKGEGDAAPGLDPELAGGPSGLDNPEPIGFLGRSPDGDPLRR